MEGDYDYDVDEMGDYDDDWLYVEDEYSLSDELAESQFASPGYAGTNYEISLETYEFELYAFWDDLEYADDAYWEYESPHTSPTDSSAKTSKRRRPIARPKVTPEKRRKTKPATGNDDFEDADPVLFRNRKDRDDRFLASPPLIGEAEPFAFLSDWKERFADVGGLVSSNPMPADMKEAAKGDADAGSDPLLLSVDEDDADSADILDPVGGDEARMADIDPDMLKAVLRQRLGDAGLQDMDEDMLMGIITQMVSGDGDADEATGHLATNLLGKVAGENGDEHLTDWLSHQGVSFQDADEDEGSRGSSITTEALPTDLIGVAHPSQADSTVTPAGPGRMDHSHSTRKRKALPVPDSSAKRSKPTVGRSQKASEPTDVHNAGMNEVSIGKGPAMISDGAVSVLDALPTSNARKRKAPEVDLPTLHAAGTKRFRRGGRERSEPASNASLASKETRSVRMRDK